MKWCFCYGELNLFFFSRGSFLTNGNWLIPVLIWRTHWGNFSAEYQMSWKRYYFTLQQRQISIVPIHATLLLGCRKYFFDYWPGSFSKSVCLLLLILNSSLSITFVRNNGKLYDCFESVVTEIGRRRKGFMKNQSGRCTKVSICVASLWLCGWNVS